MENKWARADEAFERMQASGIGLDKLAEAISARIAAIDKADRDALLVLKPLVDRLSKLYKNGALITAEIAVHEAEYKRIRYVATRKRLLAQITKKKQIVHDIVLEAVELDDQLGPLLLDACNSLMQYDDTPDRVELLLEELLVTKWVDIGILLDSMVERYVGGGCQPLQDWMARIKRFT